MPGYGRTDEEWAALEAARWDFLVRQSGLQRTTSYSEMNTVLARRSGVREFDFHLDTERHTMGELLEQLSERSYGEAGLLISVLVQFLNENDPGSGFYRLAQRKKLLSSGSSRDQTLAFPVEHVKAVHSHAW